MWSMLIGALWCALSGWHTDDLAECVSLDLTAVQASNLPPPPPPPPEEDNIVKAGGSGIVKAGGAGVGQNN